MVYGICKMHDTYLGLSQWEFEDLKKRYKAFQDTCNDLEKEPVKVFPALNEKSKAELLLNREVSKDLQKKKEEDMKKAAQAAAEPEEEKEESAEEKKPETEK